MERHDSFQSAFNHLNLCLENKGYAKVSEVTARKHFHIKGDEPVGFIIDMVNAYDDECEFDRIEARNSWKYQN
jgi:hypothetical protein